MLSWLTGRSLLKTKAGELYGKVVAAARQPAFYGPSRVSDTPEGRFELIALHLFLVVERIKDIAPDGPEIARHMIEAFVVDMDDCMREMGVGDLTVPKRVKRAAAGFYERAGAFRAALSSASQSDLEQAMADYVLTEALTSNYRPALAVYVRQSHNGFAKLSNAEVIAGAVAFAEP